MGSCCISDSEMQQPALIETPIGFLSSVLVSIGFNDQFYILFLILPARGRYDADSSIHLAPQYREQLFQIRQPHGGDSSGRHSRFQFLIPVTRPAQPDPRHFSRSLGVADNDLQSHRRHR